MNYFTNDDCLPNKLLLMTYSCIAWNEATNSLVTAAVGPLAKRTVGLLTQRDCRHPDSRITCAQRASPAGQSATSHVHGLMNLPDELPRIISGGFVRRTGVIP